MQLQMVDVVGQYRTIKAEIDSEVHRVLESGQFILGKDVGELECSIAGYLGVRFAVGCASGTDALQLCLMALGIGPGDEVITTPFTFVATTETIALLGARPVYVDIDPHTFNIDPGRIESAITPRTRAILPVHLYGQSADMEQVMAVARQRNIPVIEDAAQAFGAVTRGRKVCGFGTLSAISFFPSKNLGAFGDAGMVVTNDEALAESVRTIAIHGSRVRYKHDVLGINSRLDTLQAVILRVKLKRLDEWNSRRRSFADVYDRLLAGTPARLPFRDPLSEHIFHQYTIRVPDRDGLAAHLKAAGIPHAIYYPIPLHLQEAYTYFGYRKGDFPESETAAAEVISLPMHTELNDDQQEHIAGRIREYYGR